MRLRKLAGRLALGILAVPVVLAAADVITYRPGPWLADYQRLKHELAQGYANLDWMVERRGVDLRALDQRTTAAIRNAHSRVRALLALREFVNAFHDPHLRLELGGRPDASATTPPHGAAAEPVAAPSASEAADPPAGESCEAAGYTEADHGFGFPIESDPRWRRVHGDPFPAGVIRKTGLVRIAQLGENRYASACAAVFRPGMGQRQLQLAVRTHLQARLAAVLRDLQRRGARLLVVDATGNGGGSEWVEDVVALMSDRLLLRRGARRVGPACSRDAVWQGKPAPCPVFEPRKPELAVIKGKGIWKGPVLVLVDSGTASAAEDLAVWLQQNRVAKLAGERTAGAGCGYVDGGNPVYLEVAPITVHMPNCARFLADGTNEIEGIRPDLPLPMQEGNDRPRAAALAAMLAQW